MRVAPDQAGQGARRMGEVKEIRVRHIGLDVGNDRKHFDGSRVAQAHRVGVGQLQRLNENHSTRQPHPVSNAAPAAAHRAQRYVSVLGGRGREDNVFFRGRGFVSPGRVVLGSVSIHVPKDLVQHVVRQVVERDGGGVRHGVRVRVWGAGGGFGCGWVWVSEKKRRSGEGVGGRRAFFLSRTLVSPRASTHSTVPRVPPPPISPPPLPPHSSHIISRVRDRRFHDFYAADRRPNQAMRATSPLRAAALALALASAAALRPPPATLDVNVSVRRPSVRERTRKKMETERGVSPSARARTLRLD